MQNDAVDADLDDVIARVREQRLDVVDARQWKPNWSDKWVAFVDLIGSSARSERSPDATVNQMIRFHRAVSACAARYPATTLLRFTDCVYITSSSTEDLIKFCVDLAHYCLALNAIQIERHRAMFHHMVIARTTIAFGKVLEAHGPLPAEDRFVGVDTASLLIGEGVVAAYRLQRSTGGGLISVAEKDADTVRGLAIRGMRRPPRSVLEKWTGDTEFLTHDGVVDVPWIVMRATQPSESGLWAASYDDTLKKLQIQVRVWQSSFVEYTVQRLPIDTIKHFGAMNRHLNEVFQALRRHTRLKAWSLGQLERSIDEERSRRGI